MKPIARITLLAALVALAAPLAAQSYEGASEFPRSAIAGGALQFGKPQGEFSRNVDATFGIGGFFGWRLGRSPFAIRGDLGYNIYGSKTRRVPLGTGPLGLINVDVSTTNNIVNGGIGLQAGLPGASVRPYAGGSVGFSYFFTSSSVSGTNQSTSDAFASSTNYSDNTFAKTLFGGFYVPIGSKGAQLDLSARYHWNGDARYLTERDITFNAAGNPVLSPHLTRADLLTISAGIAFGRR
ncbi:MAG: hypothetical protein ACYC3L_03955 [Gemmatimonadaceae bacterium]